jgi:DNA-binding protein HU-beta
LPKGNIWPIHSYLVKVLPKKLLNIYLVLEEIISFNFKKMNKADLAEAVHAKLGGTKVQAEDVVETIIEGIVGTLKKGGEVSIAGLGIFSTKQRAARVARNPRTGASVNVPAMRVPKFRAAKALKDSVK